MRILLAILLASLPVLGSAQGLVSRSMSSRAGNRGQGGGPIIAERSGVVAHTWFDGVNLKDTAGYGWVAAGSGAPRRGPGYVPMFPGKGSAGPFGANRWASAAAADAFDIANFSMCVVFTATVTGATQYLFGDGNFTTVGYEVGINATGGCFARVVAGTVTSSNTILPGSLNVCCAGRNATNAYVFLNGVTNSPVVVATTSDATRSAYLGTGNAGATGLQGAMTEFYFDNNAYTDAWAKTVWEQVAPYRTK